jgi:hypothetical protein
VRFELLDDTSARELERLREDRHLCVHPTLRRQLRPERRVRPAHLTSALDVALTHPPAPGARVLERFKDYTRDPGFRLGEVHVPQTFYERIRPAARRRIFDVAAKHAMPELDPGEPGLSAEAAAARFAEYLEVLAGRDRQLARDSLQKVMDRAPHLDQATLGRAVARCGHLDVLWDVMTEFLASNVPAVLASAFHATPRRTPVDIKWSLSGVWLRVRVVRSRLSCRVGGFRGPWLGWGGIDRSSECCA